jgi:pimeloyl-ACP methyl ester carboxylesterase
MKSFFPTNIDSALRYLEFKGGGTPILFLHGLGCASSFEFPHVATAPAMVGRHAFIIDFFGYGYSDRPPAFGYQVNDHAQIIAEFVNALGFNEIDIYGHSMGGSVAIEAARLLGSQVKNLVLAEANLESGGGQFSRGIASVSEGEYVSHVHSETIENALQSGYLDWAATLQLCDPYAVYRGAKSLVVGTTPSWRKQFYNHPANKSFIFGEHSLPDPDIKELPKYGIKTFVVEKAGHSMGLENPECLADMIGQATI